jgi:hypothetical protein
LCQQKTKNLAKSKAFQLFALLKVILSAFGGAEKEKGGA